MPSKDVMAARLMAGQEAKDQAQVLELEMRVTPAALALAVDRDCTPDYKIALVQELIRRDPKLRSEIIREAQ
jgi:hypothetical protein